MSKQQANSEVEELDGKLYRITDNVCLVCGHKDCGCRLGGRYELIDMQPSDSDSPQSDANAPSHPSKTITIEDLELIVRFYVSDKELRQELIDDLTHLIDQKVTEAEYSGQRKMLRRMVVKGYLDDITAVAWLTLIEAERNKRTRELSTKGKES